MKKLVFIVLTTLIVFNISAKSSKSKSKESVHKIVFQLTTNDTLAHKSLMKQLNNITSVAPTTKIEVVCHGPGLDMLVSDKTIVLEKIKQLKAIGVDFVACEFSIKERNVPIEKIIPEAGFVKAGIIEIVTKQEQGWSYIKSGF
ncbi:MAG: DsrE family protein [Chitinophagales bacterium]|nr:DsrE family protein [Chitinophagales bacterium]